MGTSQILKERGETYGKFEDNSRVAQLIKDAMMEGAKWDSMNDDAREALHQIASKMSRLLTGDPDHLDSWEDIAGYATLIASRIKHGSDYKAPF